MDLIGRRFGRWTVVSRSAKARHWHWHCVCECGTKGHVFEGNLTTGKSPSCGCIRREATHGMTHGQRCGVATTREWEAWSHMRQRCTNPNNPAFAEYGGRGIRVCAKWDNFAAFFLDVGPRPSSQHSIDRIDVNGNYEPGNVRWATRKDQARNRRNSHFVVMADGSKVPFQELIERYGVDRRSPFGLFMLGVKLGASLGVATVDVERVAREAIKA